MDAHRLAIVAAVNDDHVLEENLERSAILASGRVPLIVERGHAAAGKAYNAGLDRAGTEYVIFAHQDIYLPPAFESQLASAIDELERIKARWGVLGVWGIRGDGTLAGRVWCTGGNTEYVKPCGGVTEVASLDEIVLVLKTATGLRFDEQLPGYHLFATDIIQQAAERGLATYVFDGPVVHNSRDNPQPLDAMYHTAYRYMQRKWAKRLPLPTACVTVTRFGWPLRKQWLRNEIARRRRKTPIRPRNTDPQAISRRLGYEPQEPVASVPAT